MKVFGCKCNYELGGGVILVAAKKTSCKHIVSQSVMIAHDGYLSKRKLVALNLISTHMISGRK